MAEPKIEVRGLKELEINLKELGDRIAKKLLRAGLKKAVEPIREDMAANAIRAAGGPTYPTLGHFADHIIAKVGITKKRGAVAKIGPDSEHWWFVFTEYGTPHTPARPFMRPALERRRREAVALMAKIVGDRIEKEAAKIHKQ